MAPTVYSFSMAPTVEQDDALAKTGDATGAPTVGIGSYMLSGDEQVQPTLSPTSPGEGLWRWWFQFGGGGDDRGQALVRGVGEHAGALYLVGTVEGAIGSEGEIKTSTDTCVGGVATR